jgi:diguanylate cyclase (GGDEF)-like protein
VIRVAPDDGFNVLAVARADGAGARTLSGHLRRWHLRSRVKTFVTSWTNLGLVLAVAGLIAAAALRLASQPSLAAWVAVASAGIAVGWGVTWVVVRRTISRPIERIASSMEMIAARDVLALVDEFASLAEGEQARHIEVHAKPVALPSDPSTRRLAEALNTTIARLRGGAHEFHAASREPCRRLFYVGPDDYLLGCGCAETMAGLLPDEGQILLMMPRFRHAGIDLRRRGFESTLRERSPGIQVAGALESRFDRARTAGLVKSFINAHPELAGIYCMEAMGIVGTIEALAELNLTGRIAVICHDTVDGTMAAVRAGAVSATVTQDAFGQGHDTAVHLFNSVACGWRPQESRLVTVSEVVTRENCSQYWQPYVGAIDSEAMAERRARPLGVSGRHLRIAVLGLDDTPFWEPVRAGALAARQELAACNASVDWIVPEGPHRDFDVALRGPAVDGLVAEGYDAIATVLYDLSLVPYLNRAVDRGVVVSTFNSEASSLQGLVATLSKERRQLEIATGDLQVAVCRDPLTGAFNRRLMDDELEEVRRSVATTRRPATIVMIDIDHFKAYNDLHGHIAGDEVLRRVAQRIQRDIRPSDRLYRYGGEEFLVLLSDTGVEEGEAVATRIARGITTLGMAHKRNEPWGVVTVSAGVAEVLPSHQSISDCVAAADAALYRSKASGRNTVATAQQELKADLWEGVGADQPRD